MVLIPGNESEDLKVTDEAIDNRFNLLKNFDLNLYPLTCKKEYLPHLAFIFDVDIASLDEKKAREILNRAITLKKYIGSLYYLEEMLKVFQRDINISEWFDYEGEPYHFKVDINTVDTPITQEFYNSLEKNINKYKNVRSVLEVININIKTDLKERYALAVLGGEEIEVLPYIVRNIEAPQQSEKYGLGVKLSECIETNLIIGDL